MIRVIGTSKKAQLLLGLPSTAEPPTLKSLCRTTVVQSLGTSRVYKNIDTLTVQWGGQLAHLPTSMKNYLKGM